MQYKEAWIPSSGRDSILGRSSAWAPPTNVEISIKYPDVLSFFWFTGKIKSGQINPEDISEKAIQRGIKSLRYAQK